MDCNDLELIRKELKSYYHENRLRSLALGNDDNDNFVSFVDGIYFKLDNDDNLVLMGIEDEYISDYVVDDVLIIPDYFDKLNSICYVYTIKNLYFFNSIVLGMHMKEISRFAFVGIDFKSIELGGVERIVKDLFNNSSLVSLSGPNVKIVDDYAFSELISLESLYLPNVEIIGDIFRSYKYLNSLKNVVFGSKLKILPNELFKCVPNLEVIIGTDGVVEVGDFCFVNTKLKEINLCSCKLIGACAFAYSDLRKIIISDKLEFIKFKSFFNIKNNLFSKFMIEYVGDLNYNDFIYNLFVGDGNNAFVNGKVIKVGVV